MKNLRFSTDHSQPLKRDPNTLRKTISGKEVFPRVPIEVTPDVQHQNEFLKIGTFIAVELVPSGGYAHLRNPIQFEDKEKCQKGCDVHNTWAGFTSEELVQYIGASITEGFTTSQV